MASPLPDREHLTSLSDSEFGRLVPKEDRPLCLPSYEGGEFDYDFSIALAYVRQLIGVTLKDYKDDIGSPLFHFVVQEDIGRLSEGAMKWVGMIPREMDPEETQNYAIEAAMKLTRKEAERLRIEEDGEVAQLFALIRNTLISILHYNLKAAPRTESLNIALNGEKNFISHQDLEAAVRTACEGFQEIEGRNTPEHYDNAMLQVLKQLGTIPEGASRKEGEEVLKVLNQAKSEAWKLYRDLGENMENAQEKAAIPGPIAKVDINDDHSSLHFFEHLRAMYGLSPRHGTNEKERYELQTSAQITWLLARLTTHPVYKNLIKDKDSVERNFMDAIYHEGNLFRKSEKGEIIYLDKQKRPSTQQDHHNSIEIEVYDSLLEGFEDLSPEIRQVYRGGFRDKDKIAILIKAIKDRQELSHIPDALAGEAVMTGITEQDLDPTKNPNAAQIQEFMIAQAKAIAKTVAESMGLTEAPEGGSYRKIPRGTYRVVPKLAEKKNGHSFNFPAIKIYFNIPTDEQEDSPDGSSIRTEFRLICSDTWLRANKQKDSMSHHEMYKMKQKVDLYDIFTARAYNGHIHPVATEFREWCQQREEEELAELQAA